MESAAADGRELLVRRRRRLARSIESPANGSTIESQCTRMVIAAADSLEPGRTDTRSLLTTGKAKAQR